MLRSTLAIIVAVVTWFVVATIGNWILRGLLPGYSATTRLNSMLQKPDWQLTHRFYAFSIRTLLKMKG